MRGLRYRLRLGGLACSVALLLSLTVSCHAGTDDSGEVVQPVRVGETVHADGISVRVEHGHLADSVSYGMRQGRFLVLVVSLHSGREALVEYGPLDWRMYTEDGATLEPILVGEDDRLGFGTLAKGGSTSGRLAFELGGHSPRGTVVFRSIDGTVEAAWQITDAEVTPTTPR